MYRLRNNKREDCNARPVGNLQNSYLDTPSFRAPSEIFNFRGLALSRRAQMEIFGLVIIVILLAIGLLFAIVILTKTPTREVERVKESVQAANFLNTIMGTTSTCGKRTVRELIQDCATSSREWIGAASCDGQNTCSVAKSMIDNMLKETLGKWGKDYKFYMNGTEAVEQIVLETSPCKGEREGSTRPEKIRTGLDITVTLQICS
ncbi:Uncharacterised protein [uncultured archaeon]|nr:Uncharacterised protein [uncultured archaeon]